MAKTYWVGFFFFVALVVLLFGSLKVSDIRITKPTRIKILFDKVEGLRKGDDIRCDGLVVGKISSLELDKRGGVKVYGHLYEALELHQGYFVQVESFSVFGGNHVSLNRGDLSAPLLPAGTELVGRAKPSAIAEAGNILMENRSAIRDAIAAITETSKEVKGLATDLREGKGTIGKLVRDPQLYDDAAAAISDSRLMMKDVRDAVQRMTLTLDKVNSGQGTAGKLLNDPSLFDETKGLVTDLRTDFKAISADLKEAVRSVREAADKANNGQGAVAKLLNDPKLGEDLQKSVENVRAASDAIRSITEKTARGEGTIGKLFQEEDLYKSAKKTLEDVDRTLGRAARAKVFVGGEYRPYPDSGMDINKFWLRIWPSEDKYFIAGASFLALHEDSELNFSEKAEGEGETFFKPDFLVMYKIPWFFDRTVGMKFGFLEGKVGGGVEWSYQLGDYPFQLIYEIRDSYGSVHDEDLDEEIRGPMQRLFVRLPLWGQSGTEWWQKLLYAVKLTAGVSRLQDDPEFFIGFGPEWEDEDIRTLVSLVGLAR